MRKTRNTRLLLASLASAWLFTGLASAGTLTINSGPLSQAIPVNLTAEGDLDWVHYGTFNSADYDHKATGASQIGNFTPLGTAGYGYFGGAAALCSWLDGAVDKMQPGVATGVYVAGTGNGYQWTIPASTSPRVLHLYVSTYFKSGAVDVSLSDGSASPVTHVVAANTAARLTVTFAANSAGQTLTVNYVGADPGESWGNIALMGASLSSAVELPLSVPPPQLSSANALKTGSTFSLLANPSGAAANGATGFSYQWQVDSGSGFADIANGTGNPLYITAGPAGNYSYRVVVTSSGLGGIAATSAPVALAVSTPTGSIIPSVVILPSPVPPATSSLDVNLTSEGVLDWVHWGLVNPTDYDYRNGIIGNYTQIGSDSPVPFSSGVTFTWTDAVTANNSVAATASGVGMTVGNGFEFEVPAATSNRLVHIYVGVNNAHLHVEAGLSDNSAPLFSDDPATTIGTLRYSLVFRSSTAGKTLKVRLTETARAADNGSFSLLSASLQPAVPLTVADLLVDPGSAVLVNQPMIISIPPAEPQGIPPFSYQWRRDTGSGMTDIAGATGRSFAFTAGSTVGTESCEVVISGVQGSITSAPVVLTRSAATGFLRMLNQESWSSANLTQEGSLDWSHWGLGGVPGWDHKATGESLIGDYVNFGSGTATYAFGNTPGSFSWTDGFPTLESTNTTGLYRFPAGNGFELHVAAAETNRMLHVYLGSFQANAHVEASLSDNSAIKVIDETLPYGTSAKFNLLFAAGSPGQTLTFKYWFDNTSGGNVTLMAATLEGVPPLVVGAPAVLPTNTVPAGSVIALNSQGAAGQPPLHYEWWVNNGSGYAPIPNSDSAHFLTSVGAGAGTRNYRVVVSDVSGSVTSAPVAVTVLAARSSLTGSSVSFDGQTADLTAEGSIDWRHWGGSGNDQKASVASQISDFSVVGVGPVYAYGGNGIHCTWTDGTSVATGNSLEGLYINGAPNGFELSADATPEERVLNVYCAIYFATMHMEARLSDNSAPIFIDESFTGAGAPSRRFTFRYSSPTPGQRLIVTWWDAVGGNVTINAASLGFGASSLQVQSANNGQVQVSWPSGTLLEAPTIDGPWTTNGAASPYTFKPTGVQKYFRALIR